MNEKSCSNIIGTGVSWSYSPLRKGFNSSEGIVTCCSMGAANDLLASTSRVGRYNPIPPAGEMASSALMPDETDMSNVEIIICSCIRIRVSYMFSKCAQNEYFFLSFGGWVPARSHQILWCQWEANASWSVAKSAPRTGCFRYKCSPSNVCSFDTCKCRKFNYEEFSSEDQIFVQWIAVIRWSGTIHRNGGMIAGQRMRFESE